MLKLEKVFFMMINNDNIYVIHRRQEILVLHTLDFTHNILLYTILKLLCCDCPFFVLFF